MSSRFQPQGGIQSTFDLRLGTPNAADIAFAAQQQINYDACNAMIAGIAFFLPSGSPDVAKTDKVQTQLQGVNVLITAASLPEGCTISGWPLGQVDWTATLAARKAALATF
jgi:hypothetical protein